MKMKQTITAAQSQSPILFLDFDGTISERDAIDALLEAFADPRWLDIEREWRAGRIGSRACLSEQIALLRATQEELDRLLDSIELDAGLNVLLKTCAAHQIQSYVISDGLDYCIHRILSRTSTDFIRHSLHVYTNHLESKGGDEWRVEFPFFHQACAHGCATCKPAMMSLLNNTAAPTIFVGDGLSDRYAAASADLVFAKQSLAAYCVEQQIPFIAYDNLADVAAYLEAALLRGADFTTREPIERVGA
jgi:2-hydroxy-3-keto-5-methylthiopentenyl-1-phosphate phosphatase